VTQKHSGWHHCGKCGEIFHAVDATLCPACQSTPIPSRKKIQVHTVQGSVTPLRKEFHANLPAQGAGNLVRINRDGEAIDAPTGLPQARRERKRKKSYTLVKILAAWLIGLIALASLIKWKWNPTTNVATTNATTTSPAVAAEQAWKSENQDLFQQAYPALVRLTSQFYENSAPESLTQLCRSRPRLSSIVFNDGPKATIYKPEAIQLAKQNIIRPAGFPLIETLWTDDRGRLIEMVFAKEDDQWLIDWESYAKSSTAPWSVFQSGEETDIGIFRLLVRERLVDTNGTDMQMSVVFYEPSLLHGGPLGPATCDFLIDRKSRDGRLITAALAARKNGTPLMGSIFPEADPPNTARVTVKIKREMKYGEKVFSIEEVTACHWMGIDHPGVDLTDAP
jgi:hypothetical protein